MLGSAAGLGEGKLLGVAPWGNDCCQRGKLGQRMDHAVAEEAQLQRVIEQVEKGGMGSECSVGHEPTDWVEGAVG